MNKKEILTTLGASTLVISAFILPQVFAKDNNGNNNSAPGPKFDSAEIQAIETAMNNNDFATWKSLMGDNKMTEKITADNFSRFVEAHKLMKEGKRTEAEAIFKELGLNQGIGFMARHKGEMKIDETKIAAIKEAIKNNDYTAWKNLMGDNKMTEKITADNFSRFVEANNKLDEAEAIFKELGVNGRGMGFGGGRPLMEKQADK